MLGWWVVSVAIFYERDWWRDVGFLYFSGRIWTWLVWPRSRWARRGSKSATPQELSWVSFSLGRGRGSYWLSWLLRPPVNLTRLATQSLGKKEIQVSYTTGTTLGEYFCWRGRGGLEVLAFLTSEGGLWTWLVWSHCRWARRRSKSATPQELPWMSFSLDGKGSYWLSRLLRAPVNMTHLVAQSLGKREISCIIGTIMGKIFLWECGTRRRDVVFLHYPGCLHILVHTTTMCIR